MQQNYIAVSNEYTIDKVYRNNITTLFGELYELSIRRSHFGLNNNHFSPRPQHKMQLLYVKTLCVHNLKSRITYKQFLDHNLIIKIVTTFLGK